MKRIVYFILILSFFWGCRKEEAFRYADPVGGLQFGYSTLERDVNFSFMKNAEGRYLGDSIQSDTLKLALDVVGFPLDKDRAVVLDTLLVAGQDSGRVARVTFLPPYTFRAGRHKDTLKFVLHRPPARGVYVVGLTFDWDRTSADFGKGVKERSVYKLKVTDRYPKPEKWNNTYFGEYTEEKYAFYVTVIGEIMDNFKAVNGQNYNRKLRAALEEYNREHPEMPKDFTFPVK